MLIIKKLANSSAHTLTALMLSAARCITVDDNVLFLFTYWISLPIHFQSDIHKAHFRHSAIRFIG